jgi:hypothetical protein
MRCGVQAMRTGNTPARSAPSAGRGQAQMAAKVAGFPLAGADFEAGVDEEHDQPQGQDGHDPPAGPGC